jgi:hypothetical protein
MTLETAALAALVASLCFTIGLSLLTDPDAVINGVPVGPSDRTNPAGGMETALRFVGGGTLGVGFYCIYVAVKFVF